MNPPMLLRLSDMRFIDRTDADYESTLQALSRRSAAVPPAIETAARDVIAAVRSGGDAAIRALTEKFEGRRLDALELDRDAWHTLASNVAAPVLTALERAAERIEAFHERERYPSFEIESAGARVGSRVTPLRSVGVYAPGGTARYPSTVLMAAIPARVAGVGEIILTTPGPSPETLAAAEIAGVDRVFVIGGAQAVAAMAYGTETVPRVDKIVGPGNAYVAAAKRLVFGDVGIDSIAGPTEVVIMADDSVEPAWIAADLLAQAEHDALAVPILIALGREVGEKIAAETARQVTELPRREIAEKSLRDFGVVIVVDALERGGARDEPARARARRAGGAQRARPGRVDHHRGRAVHRHPHARAGRRLLRRAEPRAADRGQRALCVAAGRGRLRQAHLDHRVSGVGVAGAGRRHRASG